VSPIQLKRRNIHLVTNINSQTSFNFQGSPGAWTKISFEEPKENGSWQEIRLYGSQLFKDTVPAGRTVYFEGSGRTGIQWDGGLLIPGQDGTWVNKLKINVNHRINWILILHSQLLGKCSTNQCGW